MNTFYADSNQKFSKDMRVPLNSTCVGRVVFNSKPWIDI